MLHLQEWCDKSQRTYFNSGSGSRKSKLEKSCHKECVFNGDVLKLCGPSHARMSLGFLGEALCRPDLADEIRTILADAMFVFFSKAVSEPAAGVSGSAIA